MDFDIEADSPFDLTTPSGIAKAKYEDELRAKYRITFGSDTGREVLADMLEMCNWGKAIPEGDNFGVALHNLAVSVLHKCGFGDTRTDVIAGMIGSRK